MMTAWHLLHLWILASWAGVVLVETVLELAAFKHPPLQRAVARLHYLIDLWVEIPLLVGVLLTGIVLLKKTPIDGSLGVKIAFGLAALAANGICAALVVKRHRASRKQDSDAAVASLTRTILWSWTGIPLGLAALWLGLHRAGWL